MENQYTYKKSYSRNQVSLLTKAMLIAGGFFLVIAGCSCGLMYAFRGVAEHGDMGMMLPIMLLVMLGSMIISMFWFSAMMKQKAGVLVAVALTLYVGMMSTVFGYLFALLKYKTGDWAMSYCWTAFAVVGGIFLISALMAKVLSVKGAFTIGKIIAGTSIAMLVLMLVFMILGIIGVCSLSGGVILAADGIWFLCMMGMALISFLYIVIDIWQISKTSEFADYAMDNQVPSSYVWYCGYKLLTDLMNLLLIVIMFIIRFARPKN